MTMQGFNFTERTRRILAMSREEALRLRHEYVGTEHMLLGLLREGEGVACATLENLSIDAGELQQRIETVVKRGHIAPAMHSDLPYTSRAKKALELAMSEARELGHPYVGSEHLLIGLLREEKGIAAQVLVEAGLTVAAARAETLRLLGSESSDEAVVGARPMRAPAPVQSPHDAVPRGVVIELQHESGWILRREMRTVDEAIRFLSTYEGRR